MKIRVLGAFGGEGLGHRPSSFLINDRVLIDGGSVTGALTVPEQLRIEHALVSHAHLDHIAGLVYLIETLGFCETGAAVTIASIDPVVTTLRAAARGLHGLRAVILECAFPNRLAQLADIAKHMTPDLIRRELDKLPPDLPPWIFHLTPQLPDEVAQE